MNHYVIYYYRRMGMAFTLDFDIIKAKNRTLARKRFVKAHNCCPIYDVYESKKLNKKELKDFSNGRRV